MSTDRALSWDEWEEAVMAAGADRIAALERELKASKGYFSRADYVRIADFIEEVQGAAAAGDLTTCESVMEHIRQHLDLSARCG